ncbi:primosomal protein N' [Myxococcota bacterium]|nr:primosomal protein N' [Myxococcota bacterium]
MVQPLFAQVGTDETDSGDPAAVRVALPVPVDELFDYALPSEWTERAQPGCRVRVRFRERHLTGIIVERGRGDDYRGRLHAIESVLDPEPVLSLAMLSILQDAARHVLCPIGIALATALPTGSAPRVVAGFAITARGQDALSRRAVRGELRAVLADLLNKPATASSVRGRIDALDLRNLQRDGLIEPVRVERGPRARIRSVKVASLADGIDVERVATSTLARAPKQAALLKRLSQVGDVPVPELSKEFSASILRSLEQRGLVTLSRRAAPRNVLGDRVPLEPMPELTREQAAVLAPLTKEIRDSSSQTFLLHGVTGSGKTEVYLRAVAEALDKGRQAMILVPEITLTHQIVSRVRARFGERVAVLHSGLGPGERLEQWHQLRDGAKPIAVGARSALFAPLENLGVIVIDEEHDGAYKNEEGFRYHARDLAARRARQASCPLILGSATPSLETRHAAEQGDITRLPLAYRVGDRPLPAVEIVDLAREKAAMPRGHKLVLSRPLKRAMRETLAEGGQTILFLNRRGFSTQILCFDCGHAERCLHCDIALVYHSVEQSLRCHYCDYRIEPPENCTNCGAPDTALMGLGTQRLEEEIHSEFPDIRTARLDRDNARRRGFVSRVLQQLRDREIDVLIGTQMVAKGHDYPGVRLVGVVAADIGLHLPDFRAAERTFQLLTQVAGRAGRDLEPGRAVIQTFVPDHYAVASVAQHDYEGFYAREIEHRKVLGYPPFGKLVHVVVSAEKESEAAESAQRLAESLDPSGLANAGDLELLGPVPAALSRLRGRYRYQLVVKGSDGRALREAAETLHQTTRDLAHGTTASVDVHPINML